MPSPILIQPTSTDVEALARLVHAEAANIAADYTTYFQTQGDSSTVAAEKARTLAYGTIIDVILNRAAANSSQYGTTIQAIIDKNNGAGVYQFSALPDHSATTWSELPDVSTSVNDFVSSYLSDRANGQGSIVGGATHYYNPNISNPSWGDDLQRTTGVGIDADHHRFGTLPDTDPLPGAYTIDFDGNTTTFDDPIPPIPGHQPEFFGPVEPSGEPAPYGPWIPDVIGPFVDAQDASPLVLDIDASGTIELAPLNGAGSVYWDIDEDGFREASGWVTGGDGLLCIDLNSDGTINDHGELFGGTNGYSALDAYDTNNDDAITSADAQFGSLLVWVDDNANGYSETSELHTLTSLGITSIATTYSEVNYTIAGNQIWYESTFEMNGNTYSSVDAFFAYDNTNSMFIDDYTFDPRTIFLPVVRGYGNLPDLHIAMSLDEDLLEMVQDFTALDISEILSGAFNSVESPIRDIMFRWAGVDALDPESRGDYIDARVLEFLEALVGRDFLLGDNPDPNTLSVLSLMESWGNAYEAIATRLIYQAVGASELFSNTPHYDPISDTFGSSLTIDFDVLENRMDELTTISGKMGLAKLVASIVEQTVGLANLSQQDHDDLQALMPTGITIEALANALYDRNGYGDSGDNLLFAWDGVENLFGGDGNDILVGHPGLDGLLGGQGDDTYLFNLGDSLDPNFGYAENLVENLSEGTDQVMFGSGILASETYTWTDHTGGLFIKYSNDDLIQLNASINMSGETLVGEYFERVIFDDGTVWDLTGGLNLRNDATSRSIYGSAFGDTIRAGSGGDALYGRSGNDTLVGATGDDYFDGGDGTDTVSYAIASSGVTVNLADPNAQNTVGAGTDLFYEVENLTGSPFNDTLTGDSSANVIDGGNGDDTIQGGAGNDTLTGGLGTDTVTYASAGSAVTVNLATATGQNTAGAGTDTISGFENLTGSAFNDTLTGDGNANVIEGLAGNDTMNGAGGNDTLSYLNAGSAVTVNLATATGQNTGGAGTDTISNFENLRGSAFNDTLTGDGNANIIEGGAGNDTLNGAGGTDTLTYVNAASAITLNLATATGQNTGGAGTDTVSNFENLTGSAFNDTLTGNGNANVIEGGAGNDTINGAGGTDTLTYVNAIAAISISLATGSAQNTGGAGTDTISNFENLTGSAFNDTLTGDGNANVIDGGSGNDTIQGGAGNDTLTGGQGTDTAIYASAGSAVTVNLATATGQNTVGAGTDTISGFENLTGSAFNDTLTGDGNANVIEGLAGNDTMNGAGGDDTLSYSSAGSAVTVNLATATAQNTGGAGTDTISNFEWLLGSGFNDTLTGSSGNNTVKGGAGNDTISGAAGNDILYGEAGTDSLTGGSNADTFVFETATAFSNVDTITDFSAGDSEKIDLHDILDIAFDPLTDAISDFVNFTNSGGNSVMSVDRDGDGTTYSFADVVTLTGLNNLDETTLYNNGNLLAA